MGKTCEEKTGTFATGALARKALRNLRRRGQKTEEHGKPLRVYPCPECHRFHLTTEDYEDNSRARRVWDDREMDG
jgi:hypothetical protein